MGDKLKQLDLKRFENEYVMTGHDSKKEVLVTNSVKCRSNDMSSGNLLAGDDDIKNRNTEQQEINRAFAIRTLIDHTGYEDYAFASQCTDSGESSNTHIKILRYGYEDFLRDQESETEEKEDNVRKLVPEIPRLSYEDQVRLHHLTIENTTNLTDIVHVPSTPDVCQERAIHNTLQIHTKKTHTCSECRHITVLQDRVGKMEERVEQLEKQLRGLLKQKNDEGKEQRGMKKLSTNAAKNDEIETSTTAVRRETSKLDDSKNRWNSKELESLIKGIENCILAKRELEANNLIQSIKQMIESSSYINPEYLLNMADINIRICLPIRALILLTCASRLYQNGLNPDERVERIGDCSYKAFIAISGMSIQGGRIRDITQTFAMQTCQDILKDLKSVKNANTNIKTVQEVRCLNNVGRSYGAMGYHPEEIEFYNNGIKLMELKFGSEATKYRIMGDLRNNTGVALAQLGKYLQAENSFTKAFAAFKDSEDLYERKREELIYRTTNNLKHMRDASNQYVYITR